MLTEQRRIFIEEFLKLRCKNATQAAILAGYSSKTAHSQASNIMKDNEVLEYLEQRKSEITKELQQDFFFDALEARKVMYNILRDDESSNKDKITVAKDFLDRAGFKATDKVEVEGNINNPFENLTTEQLIKLAGDYDS